MCLEKLFIDIGLRSYSGQRRHILLDREFSRDILVRSYE